MLDLPPTMKIFPVFHPWLLHLHKTTPLEGQIQEPPGPVNVSEPEEEQEWWVSEIVDSRLHKGMKDHVTGKKGLLQYKVHYPGWPEWNANPAWQPYWDFDDCQHLAHEFHQKHPRKPGPPKNWKQTQQPAVTAAQPSPSLVPSTVSQEDSTSPRRTDGSSWQSRRQSTQAKIGAPGDLSTVAARPFPDNVQMRRPRQ